MPVRRLLLPVAAPLMFAGLLVIGSQLSGDESPLPTRPAMIERAPEASAERPPEPQPQPQPGPPVDRARCIASMTVGDLGRQLATPRMVEQIAEHYREQAPPDVARAFLEGLVELAQARDTRPAIARRPGLPCQRWTPWACPA